MVRVGCAESACDHIETLSSPFGRDVYSTTGRTREQHRQSRLTLLRRSCRLDVVPMASSKMDSATTSGSNRSHAEHPCVTDSNTRALAFSWHSAVIN